MLPRSVVEIIGVPMDLGGARRGVDMGPSAVRYAGLYERLTCLGYTVRDGGNLQVADRASLATSSNQHGGLSVNAHHAEEIIRVCQVLADRVAEIVARGSMPLVLGGDHSIGMGTLAGLSRVGSASSKGSPGVLWVDAHGDINTPKTTPSGNVHGMPLAVALGLAQGPFPADLRNTILGSHTVLFALRSLDVGERANITQAGVTALTMSDIDRLGVHDAMTKALDVVSKGEGIHLSIDMDALDPNEAPGVGTPVRGGLTYREAQLVMEMLAASGQLRSIEVCEINPVLDHQNRTAALAVELISSALAQTIL